MGVIRRVRLQILSKEDLRELEENIIQLESLAKRKEAAKSQMNKVRARRGKTVSRSQSISPGTDGAGLPRTRTRLAEKGLTDRLSESKSVNSIKQKDSTSAAAIIKTLPFKKLLSRAEKLEKRMDQTQDQLKNIQGISNDPIPFLIHAVVGNSKFAKRLFKIGIVVTLLHAMITAQAKALFGPGGSLDVRKLFKDETATVNQLQLLVDISHGKTFYTDDLRVYSHITNNSSTQNSGDQDQLYKEINVGSDLL